MVRQIKVGMLVIALLSSPTIAQSQSGAEQAFMDVKMKMRESMPIEYTGDPDVEFVRSMIPHHQGAIDMAEVELEYGNDPKARFSRRDHQSAEGGDRAAKRVVGAARKLIFG